MGKKEKKTREKGNVRGIKSIRGKLLLLGAVSIIASLILGITGIYMVNSNNANNEVLADINVINLLQNSNQAAEVSFLYNLDSAYNEQIKANLASMKNSADTAVKYADTKFSGDLKKITSDIDSNVANTDQLVSLYNERGLSAEFGQYAEFMANDEILQQAFAAIESESEWVDGSWSEIPVDSMEVVTIDGKKYRHYNYKTSMGSVGQRDYIIVRMGNNALGYTGHIYVANVTLNKTVMDFSSLQPEDLSNSYGSGFKSLSIGTFNGKSCIDFDSTFDGSNGDWQEATIEIPTNGYDIKNTTEASYDIYLDMKETPVFKFALAYTGRYAFEDENKIINEMFSKYSKIVAEGNEDAEIGDSIAASLELVKGNIGTYTGNPDTVAMGEEAIAKKQEAFQKIREMDEQIIQIKKQNIEINNQITNATTGIRETIEKNTEASRKIMVTLIIIVLVCSLLFILLLTSYVMRSVQKSINGFKVTLGGISEGNMSMKADTQAGDEFDVFGKSLNSMTDKLTEILQSVKLIATSVKDDGEKLKEMAQNTSQTSSQIQFSVSGIADGAVEQAQNIEQSSGQINDLGSLMENLVNSVEELDNNAVDMKNASEGAGEILEELNASNHKMTDGIGQIAEQIQRTNVSVQEIKEAVSLISSIASQTNLLSLNASIEAARAGEAGKGFAVVATEIQQLADQSDKSASTIDQIISNLTRDFQQTMQIMDSVQEATDEQISKLEETQKQFSIVDEGIRASRDETAMMKKAITECNDVRVGINSNMMNLAAISEENAASSAETADAMERLNETINDLLQDSENLNRISEELEENLNFFSF